MLQLLHTFLGVCKLFLEHVAHFFVLLLVQHGKAVLDRFFIFFVFSVGVYNRLEFALLLHELLKALLIVSHSRFSQFIQNLLKTDEQIF